MPCRSRGWSIAIHHPCSINVHGHYRSKYLGPAVCDDCTHITTVWQQASSCPMLGLCIPCRHRSRLMNAWAAPHGFHLHQSLKDAALHGLVLLALAMPLYEVEFGLWCERGVSLCKVLILRRVRLALPLRGCLGCRRSLMPQLCLHDCALPCRFGQLELVLCLCLRPCFSVLSADLLASPACLAMNSQKPITFACCTAP